MWLQVFPKRTKFIISGTQLVKRVQLKSDGNSLLSCHFHIPWPREPYCAGWRLWAHILSTQSVCHLNVSLIFIGKPIYMRFFRFIYWFIWDFLGLFTESFLWAEQSIAQNFVSAIFLDYTKDNPKCNLYSSAFVHKTGLIPCFNPEMHL